ncbi:HAMP domain-containing sensor histidine kinase [uncultured Clostridium sp.]|uniref:sensor histidine kinase n=1 Tax=uncultured Clostridium sp. TaxID=59620 RepID=UPI00263869DC|nr:HAMP domain-containing sensor histidine kinase [uncultured Clostridium sp.]
MRASICKDERIRLSIFIIIMFIAAGIITQLIINIDLMQINTGYIKQSTAIVGYINGKNPVLAEEIIPIITGKQNGDYENGKKILDQYSYNTELQYLENPIFKNTIGLKISIIAIATLMIISIIGVLVILRPLFIDIQYLARKADEIIENKFDRTHNRQAASREGVLDKLFHKFNIMEDRIQQSIKILHDEKINLKNIINDITHQLKTPITALSMYTDILQDHRNMEEEDLDTFIYSSKEQLERMEWLVLTLLKYARLESNVVTYNKEKTPLNNTIEEAINPLKIKAKEKHQKIIFNNNKDVLYNHDKNWVAEAISNIIKNAIEHTSDGGTIEIGIEETEISIIIWIKDTGEGIPKEEFKNIFKRFYKGENSVNPASIGIGLCLSRTIIRKNNGDITLESEVGKGTTFYIKFLKTV